MPRRLVIRRDGSVLASDVTVAEGPRARVRGLLGLTEMPPGTALWLEPCRQIHTFGMRFPIDVVFLDRDRCVVAIVRSMRPWRISGMRLRSRTVVEFPAGAVGRLEAGDFLDLEGAGP